MSGCDRILARLRQGPATAGELYGLHCIVHSRVAELRKQGHVIVCEHTPGQAGSGAYRYTLVDGPLREREQGSSGSASEPVSPRRGVVDNRALASRSLSDPLTRSALVPKPSSAEGLTDGATAHRERPTSAEQLCLIEATA